MHNWEQKHIRTMQYFDGCFWAFRTLAGLFDEILECFGDVHDRDNTIESKTTPLMRP